MKDGHRLGRPKEIFKEVEEGLIGLVIIDRVGREKLSEVLTYESRINTSPALKILKKRGIKCIKLTIKPRLLKVQRQAQFEFYLRHKD